MTTLDKAVRAKLAATHVVEWPAVAEKQRSTDGTVKYLFRLDDGPTIESVYIPEVRRRTICISTQAGCPLKCAFCLTGIAGYKRNLKVGEILGQVATRDGRRAGARRAAGTSCSWAWASRCSTTTRRVRSLRILMDPEGFAVAPRKLTLSTVGILPALEKLMQEPVRPNLAISLHAPNAALRRELMPIEEKYSLAGRDRGRRALPMPRGGAVTYEYVLLRGVNDSAAHARELARLLTRSNTLQGEPDPAEPGARDPVRRAAAALGRGLLRASCCARRSRCRCAGRAARTSSRPAASCTSRSRKAAPRLRRQPAPPQRRLPSRAARHS